MKKQNDTSEEIGWSCRFHPTDWFHEVGCPHQEWTKEQLQDALETSKVSDDMKIQAIHKRDEYWKKKIEGLKMEKRDRVDYFGDRGVANVTSGYNKAISELNTNIDTLLKSE